MSAAINKPGDLRVWWAPQIPCELFYVGVASVAEAKKLLAVLADYDLFQFENKIKPDFCNAGGLECFQQYGPPTTPDDFPDWCDWESEYGESIDEYEVAK